MITNPGGRQPNAGSPLTIPKNPAQSVVSKTSSLLYNRYMAKFSTQLDTWLHSNKPKTVAGLIAMSREKSFAVLFLVLMAIPALPLPTGGISHIFEVITMLVALEMVIGRTSVWLPKKWLQRPLGSNLESRTLPYIVKKVRWLEKYSRPRFAGLMTGRNYLRVVGLIVIIFTLGSFLAPPFSGLDTIPAMGVVGIALALILEDAVLFIIGCTVGVVGILVEVSLGAAVIKFLGRYW